MEWSFKVTQPGQYEILAEVAVEREGSRFCIELTGRQKSAEVLSTAKLLPLCQQAAGDDLH